jgi:hypothetical protein
MKKTIGGETVEISSEPGGAFLVHVIRRGDLADISHSNAFEMYFLGRIKQKDTAAWSGEGERAVKGVFDGPTLDAVLEQMIRAFQQQHSRLA